MNHHSYDDLLMDAKSLTNISRGAISGSLGIVMNICNFIKDVKRCDDIDNIRKIRLINCIGAICNFLTRIVENKYGVSKERVNSEKSVELEDAKKALYKTVIDCFGEYRESDAAQHEYNIEIVTKIRMELLSLGHEIRRLKRSISLYKTIKARVSEAFISSPTLDKQRTNEEAAILQRNKQRILSEVQTMIRQHQISTNRNVKRLKTKNEALEKEIEKTKKSIEAYSSMLVALMGRYHEEKIAKNLNGAVDDNAPLRRALEFEESFKLFIDNLEKGKQAEQNNYDSDHYDSLSKEETATTHQNVDPLWASQIIEFSELQGYQYVESHMELVNEGNAKEEELSEKENVAFESPAEPSVELSDAYETALVVQKYVKHGDIVKEEVAMDEISEKSKEFVVGENMAETVNDLYNATEHMNKEDSNHYIEVYDITEKDTSFDKELFNEQEGTANHIKNHPLSEAGIAGSDDSTLMESESGPIDSTKQTESTAVPIIELSKVTNNQLNENIEGPIRQEPVTQSVEDVTEDAALQQDLKTTRVESHSKIVARDVLGISNQTTIVSTSDVNLLRERQYSIDEECDNPKYNEKSSQYEKDTYLLLNRVNNTTYEGDHIVKLEQEEEPEMFDQSHNGGSSETGAKDKVIVNELASSGEEAVEIDRNILKTMRNDISDEDNNAIVSRMQNHEKEHNAPLAEEPVETETMKEKKIDTVVWENSDYVERYVKEKLESATEEYGEDDLVKTKDSQTVDITSTGFERKQIREEESKNDESNAQDFKYNSDEINDAKVPAPEFVRDENLEGETYKQDEENKAVPIDDQVERNQEVVTLSTVWSELTRIKEEVTNLKLAIEAVENHLSSQKVFKTNKQRHLQTVSYPLTTGNTLYMPMLKNEGVTPSRREDEGHVEKEVTLDEDFQRITNTVGLATENLSLEADLLGHLEMNSSAPIISGDGTPSAVEDEILYNTLENYNIPLQHPNEAEYSVDVGLNSIDFAAERLQEVAENIKPQLINECAEVASNEAPLDGDTLKGSIAESVTEEQNTETSKVFVDKEINEVGSRVGSSSEVVAQHETLLLTELEVEQNTANIKYTVQNDDINKELVKSETLSASNGGTNMEKEKVKEVDVESKCDNEETFMKALLVSSGEADAQVMEMTKTYEADATEEDTVDSNVGQGHSKKEKTPNPSTTLEADLRTVNKDSPALTTTNEELYRPPTSDEPNKEEDAYLAGDLSKSLGNLSHSILNELEEIYAMIQSDDGTESYSEYGFSDKNTVGNTDEEELYESIRLDLIESEHHSNLGLQNEIREYDRNTTKEAEDNEIDMYETIEANRIFDGLKAASKVTESLTFGTPHVYIGMFSKLPSNNTPLTDADISKHYQDFQLFKAFLRSYESKASTKQHGEAEEAPSNLFNPFNGSTTIEGPTNFA